MFHQATDKLFKRCMRDMRFAREFFTRHLPNDVQAHIDLELLNLNQSSYIDDQYKLSEADVVYSTRFANKDGYLYLLCENQTSVDQMMAFRLQRYMFRLMEHHLAQFSTTSLPIVYPMVIYTGRQRWNAPSTFFDLFGDRSKLARDIHCGPYQLIELHQMDDEALKQHELVGLVEFVMKYQKVKNLKRYLRKLFPWLVRVEAIQGEDFVRFVLKYVIDGIDSSSVGEFVQAAHELLPKKMEEEAMTLADAFRQEGYKKAKEETMTLADAFRQEGYKKAKEETMTLADAFRQEGYKEGMQQGMQQVIEQYVQRLSNEGVAVELIAKVTGLSIAEIDEMLAKPITV